jgi:hypothetical protein
MQEAEVNGRESGETSKFLHQAKVRIRFAKVVTIRFVVHVACGFLLTKKFLAAMDDGCLPSKVRRPALA